MGFRCLVRDQEVDGSIHSPRPLFLDSTIYAAFSTSSVASFLRTIRTTSVVLGGSSNPKSRPYRKFCPAHGGCHSPNRTAKLKQFAALHESGERNSPMHVCAMEQRGVAGSRS